MALIRTNILTTTEEPRVTLDVTSKQINFFIDTGATYLDL